MIMQTFQIQIKIYMKKIIILKCKNTALIQGLNKSTVLTIQDFLHIVTRFGHGHDNGNNPVLNHG